MKRIREDGDRMLSIPDLKEMFGISGPTATALMERLPHIDLAPEGSRKRLLRVSRKDVMRFIETKRV